MTLHDACSPAPGVRVASVPRPHQHLEPVARKAARTLQTNYRGHYVGVLRTHPSGGGQPVGPSAVGRDLQRASPIKATRSAIPGHRRRGHARASDNGCFAGPIPTLQQYRQRQAHARDRARQGECRRRHIQAQEDLLVLRRWHALLLKTTGCVSRAYERTRYHSLRLFPLIGPELARIEQAQRQSLRAG